MDRQDRVELSPFHDEEVASKVGASTHTTTAPTFGEDGGHASPLLQRPSISKRTQWRIHWLGPAVLLGGLVLGIGLIIAHHEVYNNIAGTVATTSSQQRYHFVGLVLARLVGLSLTVSAAIAYRQWIWGVLRRKALRLSSIDTLFSLDQSIAELVLGYKTWRYAPFAMMLAVLLWLLQIPSLVTPGTLSTTNRVFVFIDEVDVLIPKLCQFPYTINYNPATDTTMSNLTHTGCYSAYDMNTDRIQTGLTRTIMGTAYAGQIPDFPSPCEGYNCTFLVEYQAPTMKCQSMDNPTNLSTIGYLPNNTAIVENGDYAAFYALTQGVSTMPFQFNMTLLTSVTPITYESYTCGYWNTSLQYLFSFSGSASQVTLAQGYYISDLSDVVRNGSILANDPIGPWSLITQWKQLTGLFNGVVEAVGTVDNGVIDVYDGSEASADGSTDSGSSSARDTSLRRYIYSGPDRAIAGYDPSAPGNAGSALEELSRNISVAMIQLTNFTQTTNATFTTANLIFDYDHTTLLTTYGAALIVTLILAVLGLVATMRNGCVSDFRFSTILRTTRNPHISQLVQGAELGAAPVSDHIENARLRFGVERQGTFCIRATFGHEGSVDVLRKGAQIES